MEDSYGESQRGRNSNFSKDGARGGYRNGRGPSNRDQGGFRIRLSENEMNAARTIQEAFNLRSTVAVLGFSLRTLGQMLEDGKLDSVISEYRSQNQHGNNNRDQYESSGKKFNNNNRDRFLNCFVFLWKH